MCAVQDNPTCMLLTIAVLSGGVFVTPPGGVRISDELVFLIIIMYDLTSERLREPKDFNADGHVYADHQPIGNPVIIHVFGISFVAISSGYYAFRLQVLPQHVASG
ncbi:unnamed protein product [Penicillium palitans]